MPTQEPDLNLEANIIKLIVKALNKTPKVSHAAKILGVSVHTLYSMIAKYKIKPNWQISES